MAARSVKTDAVRDLLGRALEDLLACPTWSLRAEGRFYLQGSRTPDRDYHELDDGSGATGALYVTRDEAYLAGFWRFAAFGWTISADDLADSADRWIQMPARRLLGENHDGGLGPQLAKLCDPDSELSLIDARTDGGTARQLIQVDAFGEPILWEVLTSGSSVELAGAVAGDGRTPLARVQRGTADVWPRQDPVANSVPADAILREHMEVRPSRRRAGTEGVTARFEVVHDTDAGTWSVLSYDAAFAWGVGDALTAELIARDLLGTADPALADRVSYDSELSMLCVLCESRADARLTVNVLRSCSPSR